MIVLEEADSIQESLDFLSGFVQLLEEADQKGMRLVCKEPGELARILRLVLSTAYPDV